MTCVNKDNYVGKPKTQLSLENDVLLRSAICTLYMAAHVRACAAAVRSEFSSGYISALPGKN